MHQGRLTLRWIQSAGILRHQHPGLGTALGHVQESFAFDIVSCEPVIFGTRHHAPVEVDPNGLQPSIHRRLLVSLSALWHAPHQLGNGGWINIALDLFPADSSLQLAMQGVVLRGLGMRDKGTLRVPCVCRTSIEHSVTLTVADRTGYCVRQNSCHYSK
jgi:hypothetical protein